MLLLPPVMHLPGCTLEDGIYVQYAPVRTICMLASFASILLFSYLTSMLFNKKILPRRWDVLKIRDQKAEAALTPLEVARVGENEQLDPPNTEHL